jgi:hypothetical protein
MFRTKKTVSLAITVIIVFCIVLIPIETTSAASKVKISKTSAVVTEGNYLYLSMKGTKKKATWTSSNKYKATVSKNGKVTTNGTGKVTITAKIGNNKYTCKVVIIPNIDPNYKTDKDVESELAERDYLDKFSSNEAVIFDTTTKDKDKAKDKTTSERSKAEEEALNKRIKDLLESDSSISNKKGPEEKEDKLRLAYDDFCKTWISERTLSSKYNIEVTRMWDILLKDKNTDKRYTLEDVPNKLNSGEVLTSGGIQFQYVYDFYYENESLYINRLFFNIEDLKTAGIIN